MMAAILNAQSKQAFPFAIDLGIAMQLTNIARDVLEDAENHRRYIPGDLCNDMTPKEILASVHNNEILPREIIKLSINQILHIAEKYYDSGLLGLSYLPARNHIAIGIAAIIYRQIGRKLLKKGTQWWTGRQVVGIFEKLIYSFLVIPALLNRLKTLPEHDATLHIPLKRFQYVNGNPRY
jgi:phytoene synthase